MSDDEKILYLLRRRAKAPGYAPDGPVFDAAADRIESLYAALTEARRLLIRHEHDLSASVAERDDAVRYRWLRDLDVDDPRAQIGNFPGDVWDEEIDKEIDKEMRR